MGQGWKYGYTRYKEYFLKISDLYYRKPEVKMFVEIILTLSVVLIFLVFAFKPTILTIINLFNEISSKKALVIKLDKKMKDLTSARSVYNSTIQNIPLIDNSIPKSPNVESYLDNVYSLSVQNDITILGLSTGEIVVKGDEIQSKKSRGLTLFPEGSKEIEVSFSVKGGFIPILNFLEGIEKTIRPLKIDSIGINTSGNDKQKTIVATITGRLPYIK